MNLGDRYQIDTTPRYNDLRIPEGQQPAKPVFTGVIGIGSTAEVYRCIDRQTGQAVAIKVLNKEYATDAKFVIRFQRQAKLTMNLHHPNIAQVYDYGQVDDNYYMVMELIEGPNLYRYIRTRGVLETKRAVIIAHDLALALGAAHDNGIVHSNVNSQIILKLPDTVKITSFHGRSLGGDMYYSPEQVHGGTLTSASDVYSLGTILYEMVAGHLPFNRGETRDDVIMQRLYKTPTPPSQPEPPAQFYRSIPQALENIIMRCLEISPDKRYQNGSELARALQELA